MLTDTHVHFDGLPPTGDTIEAIMERATRAGVRRMMAIGGSPAGNHRALQLARMYAGRIRAAVGYNHDQTDALERPTADGGQPVDDELKGMLAAPEVAAIGEIGLDFHRESKTSSAQVGLFKCMLRLARDYRLPVSVHTREAESETLGALREHAAAWRGAPDRIGVMHCFTGNEAFARDLLELGFMISFSGIVTFKNAGNLPSVAAMVPDDRLLIETDAPYLAPEPFRGQPNEPAHVRRVAETLAMIRRVGWEKIAALSARNAAKMFGWQN